MINLILALYCNEKSKNLYLQYKSVAYNVVVVNALRQLWLQLHFVALVHVNWVVSPRHNVKSAFECCLSQPEFRRLVSDVIR